MILLPSAARTATAGTAGSTFSVPNGTVGATFLLDVTAASTDVGDTLNVRVQHSVDDASTWDDFVSFTQVLGNGGVKQYQAVWSANYTPESEMHAVSVALAAGSVLQGPVGGLWRAYYVIVDANANGSFTFSLKATLTRSR